MSTTNKPPNCDVEDVAIDKLTQGWQQQSYWLVHNQRVRLVIKSDAVASQSSAVAYVWSPTALQWNMVAAYPFSRMATAGISAHTSAQRFEEAAAADEIALLYDVEWVLRPAQPAEPTPTDGAWVNPNREPDMEDVLHCYAHGLHRLDYHSQALNVQSARNALMRGDHGTAVGYLAKAIGQLAGHDDLQHLLEYEHNTLTGANG